ncbi:hypothetical protein [Marinomonas foliarum]|uniref:Uncharacterized protein n=1 Tax=Marinomonas foliarum TaxID=491950 RepID=A0A368ZWQ0_9GAMM|nr:hypothetical protein [Marinomonas foliarum]QRV24532.1 hypothetical protein JSY38_03075 [Marinomonas foliarum]RCX00536.1 hypothetical protein DFP77_12135 [Marinomonas foliarum]
MLEYEGFEVTVFEARMALGTKNYDWLPTYINAYSPLLEVQKAVVDGIVGRLTFCETTAIDDRSVLWVRAITLLIG